MSPDLPESLRARYRVVRALGAGAYGTVVLAEDTRLGRPVAVKVLSRSEREGDMSRSRFEREARLTARLHSSHVAKVLDHDVSGEPAWIVYEFVEGRSLQEILKAGPRPFDQAAGLFRDVLDGLAALHAEGVLHRDLKPANIMVTSTGSGVLIDLGLGRSELEDSLTATGRMVGSPAYMAPDQMNGKPPGPTWDLYAATLILVEMITGRMTFLEKTLPLIYTRKLQGWTGDPVVPRRLDPLLRRALAADPAERFERAEQLRLAFDEILEASDETPPPVAAAPEEAPGPPARPPPPATAATGSRPRLLPGLLAAGLALGMLQVGGAERGPPPATAPATDSPARLAALRARLEGDPAIGEALELAGSLSLREALEVWTRARTSFRRVVRESELRALVTELGTRSLSSRVYRDATWIRSCQLFLERTTSSTVEPLLEPEADPGLPALLAQGTRWLPEPSMSGPSAHAGDTHKERYLAALPRGGRTWKVVRSYQDLPAPEETPGRVVTDLHLQNPSGVPFDFPLPEAGGFLLDGVYDAIDQIHARLAPSEALHELHPFEGDLWLAFQIQGWQPTTLIRFDVIGWEGELPVVFAPPPLEGPRDVGCCPVRQGFLLQVARGLLPARPTYLRIRLLALQPLSSPRATLDVEEVYQLVAGPAPG